MLFKMNKAIMPVSFILFSGISFSQTIEKNNFKSLQTGDEYEIVIKKPKSFDSTKQYTLVYFTDASLNSGKYILNLDDSKINNCVLVGIGHTGNHVMRRQRDFIPSDAGGYRNDQFGQASKFYLFVKEELMPYVGKKIPLQKTISPSVWANYEELLKMEEAYKKNHTSYEATIYLYAGSLEVFNKVLSSTTQFYNTVKKRKYTGLSIFYKEIEWANHYGTVEKVVPGIFQRLK